MSNTDLAIGGLPKLKNWVELGVELGVETVVETVVETAVEIGPDNGEALQTTITAQPYSTDTAVSSNIRLLVIHTNL
jgi:hypothetical protein